MAVDVGLVRRHPAVEDLVDADSAPECRRLTNGEGRAQVQQPFLAAGLGIAAIGDRAQKIDKRQRESIL